MEGGGENCDAGGAMGGGSLYANDIDGGGEGGRVETMEVRRYNK